MSDQTMEPDQGDEPEPEQQAADGEEEAQPTEPGSEVAQPPNPSTYNTGVDPAAVGQPTEEPREPPVAPDAPRTEGEPPSEEPSSEEPPPE